MPLSLATVNTQPPEPPALREDGMLEVHSVFATIQGEGPLAGTPAVFVRTAGCNLQCERCDTEYTSRRELLDPTALVRRVLDLAAGKRPLVVVTGGEPYRQNIDPFVCAAVARGMRVQVETNGTLCPEKLVEYDDPEWYAVVVSPKTPKINAQIDARAVAFKYILDADHVDPDDGLPTATMGLATRVARPRTPRNPNTIFLQPLDVGDQAANARHARAAVAGCLKYGYRLSYQIHKQLDLP